MRPILPESFEISGPQDKNSPNSKILPDTQYNCARFGPEHPAHHIRHLPIVKIGILAVLLAEPTTCGSNDITHETTSPCQRTSPRQRAWWENLFIQLLLKNWLHLNIFKCWKRKNEMVRPHLSMLSGSGLSYSWFCRWHPRFKCGNGRYLLILRAKNRRK